MGVAEVAGCVCDGKVSEHDKCFKCGEDNAQYKVVYGFKANLSDIGNEDVTLSVTCGPGAGRTMFGMEAVDFAKLNDSQKLDKIESISGVPVVSGMVITHDPDKNDTFVCLFNVAKLDV